MSDTAATLKTPPSDSPNPSSSNATEQARIRKQRREAKIRAGSTARLNKITGLNNEKKVSDSPLQKITSTPSHLDSEVVDTAKHDIKHEESSADSRNDTYSSPGPTSLDSSTVNEEALREMMRRLNSMSNIAHNDSIDNNFLNPTIQNRIPYLGNNAEIPSIPDDPMIKIMQQLMGETLHSGESVTMPKVPGLNNNLEKPTTVSPYDFIWRFAHAFWAVSLGIYIAMITQYTGTEIERERSFLGFDNVDDNLLLFATSPKNFFYLFITIEAILLGTRYFLDREDTKPGGILGMLIGALQEPIRGYLQLGLRYMNIWSSVSRDALICLFVLGAFAWWRN
ncbi:hypothetical protein OnM2_028035 [Erysiphe neolycopersici]|uniref:Golgi to ER traffic protein 2 n=1 Tax=Erysiphe neolycopersici TaxID=212602 RepID=A0A420I077_9PEZI|nr:hypothetical protein OnM2_028035 [Erysiphe neolycopersici]